MSQPQWLTWAQSLQSIAQAGLTYAQNPFDLERYAALRDLAAEIVAHQAEVDPTQMHEIFLHEAGYPTPKVDVRGVVIQDGQILLVKELSDGGWTLPGGWVDVNEPPSRAVEREVWEESGYQVRAARLLALYDRNLHGHPAHIFHIYKLFFLCELTGGAPADSIETAGASFFSPQALPPLSLGRTTPEEIERLFVLHQNPAWPTDFD